MQCNYSEEREFKYLHDESFQADSVVRVAITVVKLEVVVENETGLHIGGHCDSHCGSSYTNI